MKPAFSCLWVMFDYMATYLVDVTQLLFLQAFHSNLGRYIVWYLFYIIQQLLLHFPGSIKAAVQFQRQRQNTDAAAHASQDITNSFEFFVIAYHAFLGFSNIFNVQPSK